MAAPAPDTTWRSKQEGEEKAKLWSSWVCFLSYGIFSISRTPFTKILLPALAGSMSLTARGTGKPPGLQIEEGRREVGCTGVLSESSSVMTVKRWPMNSRAGIWAHMDLTPESTPYLPHPGASLLASGWESKDARADPRSAMGLWPSTCRSVLPGLFPSQHLASLPQHSPVPHLQGSTQDS